MSLKLSIVIATYNRAELLPFCLEALSRQSAENSDFEIILIDNNSTDHTKEISSDFKNKHTNIEFRYLLETNQGLSFGRNRGVIESSFQLITFLDDDAEVESSFVQKIIDAFKNDDKLDALGGTIIPKYLGEEPKWLSNYISNIFGRYVPSNQSFIYTKNDYPRGSNMSFHRRFFDEVGMFSTNLGRTKKNFLGGEERELFERAYKKNLHVKFVPEISCDHLIPEFRTKLDVVRKQTLGIGLSKKIVYKNQGKSLWELQRDELIKLLGSFILAIKLTLNGKFSAGVFLIKFRIWIFKGMKKEML